MIHRLWIKRGPLSFSIQKKEGTVWHVFPNAIQKGCCASTDRHCSIAPVTTSTTTEQAAAATHLPSASQHAYSQRVYETAFRVEGRAGSFPP